MSPANPNDDVARIACGHRFTKAIERARNGDYTDCVALVKTVEGRFCAAAAHRQRREL